MTVSKQEVLDGRIVLVTGASKGIGRAVAVAASAAGARVIACGRDVSALERLADEIEASGALAPLLLPINLERATIDDYASVARHLDEQCGGLDGLVVNAGVLGELAPLAHYDAPTWARVFQVNVHSAFLLLQAVLPLLQRSRRAAIVFTLAADGQRAKANWGAYAVSNYALRGLMELCAQEMPRGGGVHVAGVVPPAINTALRMVAYPAGDPAAIALPAGLGELYVRLLSNGGAAQHGKIVEYGHAASESTA